MNRTSRGVFCALLALLAAAGSRAEVRPVPDHAVVLIYHHVAGDTPPSTSVRPEVFAAHLDSLAAGGHRVLPLPEIVARLRGDDPVPDLVVGLSFDDGYRSVHTTAFPLLKERGWPFTVFVCPDAVDAGRGGVLDWDRLREMAAHGATIASHGLRHEHLQRRRTGEDDAAWAARVRAELLAAQERIVAEIGQAPPLLAYPYGEADPALQALVAELGWAAFGQQSGACGKDGDFTLLPRFPMAGPYADPATFGEKVRSLPLPVLAVRPASPLVAWPADADARRPVLELELPADRAWRLAAYAGGQGRAEVAQPEPGRPHFVVRAREPLGPGRGRYNVTAPFGTGGRYYWYSRVWIVGDGHRD